MDSNSIKNQDIKGKFVGRHVLHCQTGVIEEIAKNNENFYGELDNFEYKVYEQDQVLVETFALEYVDGELTGELTIKEVNSDGELITTQNIEADGVGLEDLDTAIRKWAKLEDFDLDTEELNIENVLDALGIQGNHFEDEDELTYEYEQVEVLEWWLVDDFLGDKLKEKGYVVYKNFGCTWWGRSTSGQAILLDYAITQICSDMEILEGQKNQW